MARAILPKACPRCKIVLPPEDFYRYPTTGHLSYRCKRCECDVQRERRIERNKLKTPSRELPPRPQNLPEGILFSVIPGHERYAASSDGRIWTSHLKGRYRDTIRSQWKEMVPSDIGKGYMSVRLKDDDGKLRNYKVHSLILLTFVGPCPQGMEACHFPDRRPSNNALDNLRWDTKSSNAGDKYAHGTMPIGNNAPGAVLTESNVAKLRLLHQQGVGVKASARVFGISNTTARKAMLGETWKCVADVWDHESLESRLDLSADQWIARWKTIFTIHDREPRLRHSHGEGRLFWEFDTNVKIMSRTLANSLRLDVKLHDWECRQVDRLFEAYTEICPAK